MSAFNSGVAARIRSAQAVKCNALPDKTSGGLFARTERVAKFAPETTRISRTYIGDEGCRAWERGKARHERSRDESEAREEQKREQSRAELSEARAKETSARMNEAKRKREQRLLI